MTDAVGVAVTHLEETLGWTRKDLERLHGSEQALTDSLAAVQARILSTERDITELEQAIAFLNEKEKWWKLKRKAG